MPALGGYGIAELEGMESQERGCQHVHRRKYDIPNTKERHVIDLFKEKGEAVLHSLLLPSPQYLLRQTWLPHFMQPQIVNCFLP